MHVQNLQEKKQLWRRSRQEFDNSFSTWIFLLSRKRKKLKKRVKIITQKYVHFSLSSKHAKLGDALKKNQQDR